MTQRFTDNGNGTITDTLTGLVWEQGGGLVWWEWQHAVDRCRDLRLGGYADWRLPRIEELLTIVDYGRRSPACDPVFGAASDCYWSSNTYASVPGFAWFVDFSNGDVFYGGETSGYYARAVRGGRV